MMMMIALMIALFLVSAIFFTISLLLENQGEIEGAIEGEIQPDMDNFVDEEDEIIQPAVNIQHLPQNTYTQALRDVIQTSTIRFLNANELFILFTYRINFAPPVNQVLNVDCSFEDSSSTKLSMSGCSSISAVFSISLIENYCREAGVRNLQKQIAKIYRKIALKLVRQGAVPEESAVANDTEEAEIVTKLDVESPETQVVEENPMSSAEESKEIAIEKVMIDESNLVNYVGKPVFHAEKIYEPTPVGVVMGLAWTSMGGSTLYIETTVVEEGEGKGGLTMTGHLGDVMKESAQIAHTVARTRESLLCKRQASSPCSCRSHTQGRSKRRLYHVAITCHEETRQKRSCNDQTSHFLTGRILPIGGVKEKTIAARRSQVKTIIFREANRRDFDELADNVKEGLDVHFVDDYEKIFELAFQQD